MEQRTGRMRVALQGVRGTRKAAAGYAHEESREAKRLPVITFALMPSCALNSRREQG